MPITEERNRGASNAPALDGILLAIVIAWAALVIILMTGRAEASGPTGGAGLPQSQPSVGAHLSVGTPGPAAAQQHALPERHVAANL